MNNIFQVSQRELRLAIAKANRALDPSDNGDAITADELQRAADELQKTVESVVSAGLPKSNPLVVKTTNLSTVLGDITTKVSPTSDLHGVYLFDGSRIKTSR